MGKGDAFSSMQRMSLLVAPRHARRNAREQLIRLVARPVSIMPEHEERGMNRITSRLPTIRPECELGLGCMYSNPSARFSALHTFQAFGNSEKPRRNNGLRGALAVE
jgi:hypothetical protein